MYAPRANLLNRGLHIAGAAIVALAVAAFYALAYRPLVAQGLNHESRINQLTVLQQQAGDVHREHRALRERLAAMEGAIASVKQRAPDEPLDIQFVSDVREIAESQGLEVTEHRMTPGRASETHSQTEVHLKCLGSYESICRFLHKAENLARLVKISSVSIQSPAADARLPLEVTFVLYYDLKSNDTDEKR